MLVIDGIDGITEGDKRVGGYMRMKRVEPAIIVVNKWDVRTRSVGNVPGPRTPMTVLGDEVRDSLTLWPTRQVTSWGS